MASIDDNFTLLDKHDQVPVKGRQHFYNIFVYPIVQQVFEAGELN